MEIPLERVLVIQKRDCVPGPHGWPSQS
ncbi:MAG: hypothetical protein R2693_06655 [Nocardioidaceae bacterium]